MSATPISAAIVAVIGRTGLKINLNTEIQPQDSVEITIDFDAAKSIVETGNDQFKLKPVIKLQEVIFF